MPAVLKSFLLAAVCAQAASAAAFDFVNGGDVAALLARTPAAPKAITPAPAAAPLAQQPPRNWTVMVYMSGKNELTFMMRDDLNELEEVGSTPDMNVVAQLGTIGPSAQDRPWMVDRVFVQKDDYPNWISSLSLERRDKADMGDWRELADFVNWSKANFPARKYMLIVSGHGSGWHAYSNNSSTEKGIAFDDASGRHIDTRGLKLALEHAGGVDVFAADSCLMQMAEVAYEIRKSARFIVGSEEVETDGYQYRDFLLKATAAQDPSPRDLAAAAVKSYVQTQLSGTAIHKGDVTHSYLNAAALDGLAPLIDAWTAAALKGKDKKAIKQAIAEVKRFDHSDYMDLVDFMRLSGTYARTPELREASERAGAYLTGQVIGLNAVSGASNARAYGLSIWIPYAFLESYKKLDFARDTQWDEFVATLVKHTYPN